jgi:hypothetical protein
MGGVHKERGEGGMTSLSAAIYAHIPEAPPREKPKLRHCAHFFMSSFLQSLNVYFIAYSTANTYKMRE